MIDVCNRYNANCKEQWPGGTFVYCQYSLLGPELRKSVSNICVPPFLCIHLINVSCIAGVIHVYKSGFNKQCYWTQKQTLSPQTTSLNPKGPTLLHNQCSLFNRFPAKPPPPSRSLLRALHSSSGLNPSSFCPRGHLVTSLPKTRGRFTTQKSIQLSSMWLQALSASASTTILHLIRCSSNLK